MRSSSARVPGGTAASSGRGTMGASVPSTSRITAARSGASASRAIASMAHRISPMGLIVVGLVAGLFSALFGVGGGIVIVPMLLLLHRYTTRVAMATSLV